MPTSARPWFLAATLAAIVAGAALLRFVDLSVNPGGLYTDEATEGLSALRLLHEPGYHPLFFPEGGGREALFAYLVAGAFSVFGETTLVLRGTAAAIGVAGVLAVGWMARRYGTGTALVAAAWAAGALWLVCISRDGMRNTLVPLFEALAFAALLAWQARPGRATAVAAGAVVAAASLYTYQPLKLLPLLVLLWLAWLRRTDAAGWARIRGSLPLAAGAFLLVAAPMLVVAISDPGAYFGRAIGVTVLNPHLPVSPLEHVVRTLGMAFATGDPNPRHDVAELPMLGWPAALVALAGLARIWRGRRDPALALVGLALPVFLVPPLLAAEGGAPHFLRSLGLAVPVAVAVGLGATGLVEAARRRLGPPGLAAGTAAVAIGLVALAVGSATAYLGRPVADRYAAFSYDLVALAEAAGPRDAVLLDDYRASVVRFLDAEAPPTILDPAMPVAAPGRYDSILAVSLDDIARTLGQAAVGRARVIARDPDARPVAWGVTP